MTRFLNGGGSLYLGYQFTTAVDLIDTIESELVAKGWSSLTKVSGVSLFIRGQTLAGSHNCWVEFTVTGSSPDLTLAMQGWRESTKVNGSGANYLMTFTAGSNNSLWLTSEQDAFNICINNQHGAGLPCVGYHFGFPIRVDNTDSLAVYIGAIRTHYQRLTAPSDRPRVSSHFITGTSWAAFSNGAAAGVVGSANLANDFAQSGTIDLLTRISIQDNATTNSTDAQFGAVNPLNNKPVIDPRYYYLEFRGATTNVTVSYSNFDGQVASRSSVFRGTIQNVATGGAALGKAFQCTDIDGKRYLSVGNAIQGWQLMRIL